VEGVAAECTGPDRTDAFGEDGFGAFDGIEVVVPEGVDLFEVAMVADQLEATSHATELRKAAKIAARSGLRVTHRPPIPNLEGLPGQYSKQRA
jgi:hypothetical protein